MKPFDEEQLRESIEKNLGLHQNQTGFAEVWNKYNQSNPSRIRGKLKLVPQVIIVTLLAFYVLGFMLTPRVDKIDYPFRDDPAVIGKWVTVDLVKKPDKFIPGQKLFNKELYITAMVFIKDGSMLYSLNEGNGQLSPAPGPWTRGLVLNREDKTASQYFIKNIQGNNYMFCQWKNGDYQYFRMDPFYFVLKQADNLDYSDYQVTQTIDKTDYQFIIDKQALGSWQAVDFVRHIDEFDPGSTHIPGEPLVQTMDFRADGRLILKTLKQDHTLKWTRDYVIDEKSQTASRYSIKQIDGKAYIFMEWKNGDYMYRGVKPSYYVFEKQSP